MSNIGKPCPRQLWYEINTPEKAKQLRPEEYLKFLYGHILEELLLFLVELSGHKVEGRQDEQEIEGVKGHRDVVIDGVLVDVKSASSYSFKKFKEGRLKEDDAFGYITQLQSYLYSSQNDPKVIDKNRAAFLVIDKSLGHICLDFHEKSSFDWPKFFRERKELIQQKNPPERGFKPIPEGKSGNLKLNVNCSYCAFKDSCWPEKRTFLYYNGPVDLVKIVRQPNVPELK